MKGLAALAGAAALAATAGCAPDPGLTGVAGVREMTAAEAAGCRYITDIRMTPGLYGPLASEGLKYARNKVRAEALASGANALVFDQATPGQDVYEVHAVAYACP